VVTLRFSFLSEDPLSKMRPSAAQGVDRTTDGFRYVVSNPISFTDPLGCTPCGPMPAEGKLPPCAYGIAMRDWGRCQWKTTNTIFLGFEGLTVVGVVAAVATRQPAPAIARAVLVYLLDRIRMGPLPKWGNDLIGSWYSDCKKDCMVKNETQACYTSMPGLPPTNPPS